MSGHFLEMPNLKIEAIRRETFSVDNISLRLAFSFFECDYWKLTSPGRSASTRTTSPS